MLIAPLQLAPLPRTSAAMLAPLPRTVTFLLGEWIHVSLPIRYMALQAADPLLASTGKLLQLLGARPGITRCCLPTGPLLSGTGTLLQYCMVPRCSLCSLQSLPGSRADFTLISRRGRHSLRASALRGRSSRSSAPGSQTSRGSGLFWRWSAPGWCSCGPSPHLPAAAPACTDMQRCILSSV